MNTPPKMRRFKWEPTKIDRPDGQFAFGLTNPDYAIHFAAILTEFNALEANMPMFLATLLRTPDMQTAGYIYRAIINPRGRSAVMQALLHKAPHNANLGSEYDDMLAEYEAIGSARNGYAHGLWYTHVDTGKVFLSRRDEHGFAILDAAEEPIEKLTQVISRIRVLTRRITDAYVANLKERGL